ncbi:SPOR domain-containing protein [Paenibacillus oenotherae]|uniref:SPOR domain-containing protein n=1 Tax=Paenibacillus oenotherae TaxID=1435645 RepID=A0ABS7D8E8_9BACL|nr:SPOR domain-containing protein [Paenibacillus oenotherae]MBW7476210.1 SPOR domain-containing protein [Paenibacillus oenotherae]
MNPKARITYRFDKTNGPRQEPQQEETERRLKSNVVPFFQEELKFTSDIGAWNSPFQDDARALEKLIRDTERKDASATSQRDRSAAAPLFEEQKPSSIKRAAIIRDPFEAKQPANSVDPSMHPHIDWSGQILLGDESQPFDSKPQPAYETSRTLIRDAAWDDHDRNNSILSNELMDQEVGHAGRSSFKTASIYRSPRGPSWFKVLASVVGAVATGALFGYLVLTLFTAGDSGLNAADIATEMPGAANAANSGSDLPSTTPQNEGMNALPTAGNDTTIGTEQGTAATAAVNIPAVSYYMLQYGVFSSKEGLDEALAGLNDKGLAAAQFATGEDYRVYAGMAQDRGKALVLGNKLANLEVYMKQIDLPALSALPFAGDAAVAETFFQQTRELTGQLDAMTIARLTDDTSDVEGSWSELHQNWTRTAALMESGVTDSKGRTALHKLAQAINTAAVAAGEYEKKSSDAHLWSVQRALMEAVFVQKDWFASMDAL